MIPGFSPGRGKAENEKEKRRIHTKRKVIGCLGALLILALCALLVISLTTGMRKGPKMLTYAESTPWKAPSWGKWPRPSRQRRKNCPAGS